MVDIVIPSLGESVTEATIAKLHKKAGEQVKIDDLLIELDTDKVTIEVNAPSSGVIKSLSINEGDVVEIGNVVGNIAEGEVSQQEPVAESEVQSKEAAQPKENVQSTESAIMSPAAQKIAKDY